MNSPIFWSKLAHCVALSHKYRPIDRMLFSPLEIELKSNVPHSMYNTYTWARNCSGYFTNILTRHLKRENREHLNHMVHPQLKSIQRNNITITYAKFKVHILHKDWLIFSREWVIFPIHTYNIFIIGTILMHLGSKSRA